MKKINLLTLSVLTVFLVINGCGNSTDSGESEPTLEEVIPNSTWYGVNVNDDRYYDKYIVGDLNTSFTVTLHEFPCGSSSVDETTGDYEIVEDNQMFVEWANDSTETLTAINISADKIDFTSTSENVDDTLTTRTNCEDL